MLVVLGAFVMLSAGITGGPSSTGSVLDATATPGPGRTGVATGVSARIPDASIPRPSVESTAAAEVVPAESEPTLSADPTATPRPSAVPETLRPEATSDRMAVLTRCPDRSDCYIYVVRRGDNLVSISNWFGIPYETVLRLNRQLRDPGRVHAGDRITLPTPTR
jgi:hypothetical protein